jgi:hypothetical protein
LVHGHPKVPRAGSLPIIAMELSFQAREFVKLFERFSDPGINLKKEEEGYVYRMAFVCSTHLMQEGEEFMVSRSSSKSPVLKVYQNDGTGITAAHRMSVSLEGFPTIIRKGRRTTECVGERLYLVGEDTGEGERVMRCVARQPLPVVGRKDAWPFFEAGRTLLDSPLQMGFEALSCEAFIFDGLLFSRLTRLIRQEEEDTLIELYPEEELRALVEMRHVKVFRPCCCHNAHNSLSWGLCIL